MLILKTVIYYSKFPDFQNFASLVLELFEPDFITQGYELDFIIQGFESNFIKQGFEPDFINSKVLGHSLIESGMY